MNPLPQVTQLGQLASMLRTLSLAQPVVLLVLVPAVLLVILAARSRLRLTSTPLRVGIVATRLVVVALVVLALAQPTLHAIGRGRAVVFAVDTSDSITPDQLTWARTWVSNAIAALPPGSLSSVIEFGSRAQLAGAAQPLPTVSTDLSAALEMAGSIVQHDAALAPEIVLLTDGWQTTDSQPIDALPSGVAVSYVALPSPAPGQRPPAVIHALYAPSISRVGDHVDVQLDLQAAQPADAQLRLRVDQTTVANGPIHLEPGDAQLTLPAPIPAPGFAQIRADLRVGDQTSTLSSIIVVKPAGKVLALEDHPGDADALATLLSSQGLQVVRQSAASVPPQAQALADYDGVLLVNTPATSLSLDQQRTLQSYVQDMGRGLVVTGGPRTFSPGGYEGSVLDDVLPVSATPPIEPQQGSLALFLVVDRSGSMDIITGGGTGGTGATKMAMAREAAIQAAGLLQPDDTLGVLAFDSSFQWVVPPTKLHTPDDVKQIQARIATIKAGGGTSILPPLQAAFEAASNSDAPLKHIVLMTDGESNDRGYEDLLSRMSANQITLSTLAIGSDADTRLLTSLAHLGGGRYYFTERATQIPRIASKETSILTRNAVVEGQVAAVVGDPSPILRSISGDLPALSGYVATTRKDRAVTALETQQGHPLLAHWQYGLGRVVAWTSQAQQGWASAWAQWPDALQFWSQAVRWALPAPVQANFQPSVQVASDGRRVTLSVQALADDGRYADQQDTRATVMSPDGSARELALPQRGPGVYSLETEVSAPGQYRVLFTQGQREEVAAFSAPDSVERHSVGTNAALLDQLATASGGHALRAPTDLTGGNGPGPKVELWPWLLLASLLLLPLDVYLRRRT
jgi:Mg-chelatase subunit ChlD